MAEETLDTPSPSPEPANPESTEPSAAPTPAPEPAPAEAAPPPESTAESVQEPPERVVPDVDGYTLPEGIPRQVAEFAHQNQLTQEQLNATIKHFGEIIAGSREAELTSLRQMGEAYVKNLGDEANYKISLAKRALRQNDPDGELAKALNETGYGNHPAVLNFLVRLGESMREGGFLKSNIHRPPGEKTAAQAMYGNNHPSSD